MFLFFKNIAHARQSMVSRLFPQWKIFSAFWSIANLLIAIFVISSFFTKQAYADVDFFFDLFVETAKAPELRKYEVTDTVGKFLFQIDVDYTSEEGTKGVLRCKASELGEEKRIKGFTEHDEDMAKYKRVAQKRANTLLDSSLGQYESYHNGVAKTAAFASSLAYADNLRTKTELEKAGFTLIKYFDDRRESQDNQFFLADKTVDGKKKYLIAIRGTEFGLISDDVKRDLNVPSIELSPFGVVGKVHKGFGTLAQAVYEEPEVQKALQEVKENKADLLITGHSLGGAAANIFSAILQENGVPLDNMQTYTFGAPPIGNEDFFARYESRGRIFRVREKEDPVPYSAYLALYKHIGEVHTFANKFDTYQEYIPPEESAKSHISISDIREDVKTGFIQIYSGGELTVVAISEAGEGIYRLTTAASSILVTISNGSLSPLSDYDLNPFTRYDENALIHLIEDINELGLGVEKIKEAFNSAIEAGKAYVDGIADEIVAISKSDYKLESSKNILKSIIPYHLVRLSFGYEGHAHSMDNTYLDIINDFHSTEISQNLIANNTLIEKTEPLAIVPVLFNDAAKLSSETPQDDSVFEGGATFTKKWTLENTGTSTWDSNYKLRYVNGNGLSISSSEVKVVGIILPGSNYTFEVPMKVPSAETTQRTLTDTWEFVGPTGTIIKVNNSSIVWARIKISPLEGIECHSEEITEAVTGFTWPLPYSFNNNGGYQFKQEAQYSLGLVYHPGEDWNVPASPGGFGDEDKGLDVVAVADGKVVFLASNSWGGLVIQHNYQGNTWYSQYGHVQNIAVSLGNTVTKGQKVAEIGRVGIGDSYAHLHFEIRTANHPNPCIGYYWSYGSDGLYNLSNVENWYEDPDEFIPAHPAYSNAPPITVHTISQETGEIVISGQNLDSVEYINIQKGLNDNAIVQLPSNLTQDETIPLNVFQQLGLSFSSLNEPLKLELFDADNNLLYKICYPFADVCPKEWMAHSTTFLWKKDIIRGYGKDWEGYFRPYISATRAEFIAALVRAIEGNNPTALTIDPFGDVSKDEWYAPFVQYAKDLGLIQGCDTTKNLFCPDNFITRAEALKVLVLAYPHLKQLAVGYQQGKTPKKTYLDVTDKQQWYYPYIYAAQAANVANGYKDSTFEPNSSLNRAEMAQLVCIAQFGVMACTDMGDQTTKALVFTVSPYKAQLNQETTFTVYGIKLSETMTLSVQDCNNLTRISHTLEQQTYQCTPTTNGVKIVKVLDDIGKSLYSGTIKVEGVVTPVTLPGDTSILPPTETTQPIEPEIIPPENCTVSTVTEVIPLTATLDQETIFTVNGSCLPDTLAFYIDECPNQVSLGGNSEQKQFRCTPSYKTGEHIGVVKTQSGGSILLDFSVNYIGETATTETIINCSPTVSKVTPLAATLNQETIFTVNGSCLPDTLAFYIDECPNQVSLGGNLEQKQFRCTPSYKTGEHIGVVKTQSGGSTLLDFSINYIGETVTTETITNCSPTVSKVTPLSATLGQSTTFTVEGDCLPDSTAFYIDECAGQTNLGGTATKMQFRCTPGYKTGSHIGLVKDQTGGTELLNFNVNYEWGTPSVDSVTPRTARLNQLTSFAIKGSSLFNTTAAWIDGCAGLQMLNGDANDRGFQCTPAKSGTVSIIVKDKSGGTELYNSTVTVQ